MFSMNDVPILFSMNVVVVVVVVVVAAAKVPFPAIL